MEQNLQHTNNTSTAYTWKSLSADLTVLNEITPGWKGKDEDGPFHVIIGFGPLRGVVPRVDP